MREKNGFGPGHDMSYLSELKVFYAKEKDRISSLLRMLIKQNAFFCYIYCITTRYDFMYELLSEEMRVGIQLRCICQYVFSVYMH